MRLFNEIIREVREFIQARENLGLRKFQAIDNIDWREAGPRDIVLQSDLGVELGNPMDASVSFLAWTGDDSLVSDGRISLAGPDIVEAESKQRLPMGKVVLVKGRRFNEDNCYERFREMDLSRYEISLKGYMMRAVSQYMREWSRVSREAVAQGFSFSILGSALINKLKEMDYVDSAEVIFVTSSKEDVLELKKTGDRFMGYINAMTKMTEEMDFDCETCEFKVVCEEAVELRAMRKSLIDKGGKR